MLRWSVWLVNDDGTEVRVVDRGIQSNLYGSGDTPERALGELHAMAASIAEEKLAAADQARNWLALVRAQAVLHD